MTGAENSRSHTGIRTHWRLLFLSGYAASRVRIDRRFSIYYRASCPMSVRRIRGPSGAPTTVVARLDGQLAHAGGQHDDAEPNFDATMSESYEMRDLRF